MNFNFINENIAIGQKIDSQELADALHTAGITHVINLWSNNETFWRGPNLCFIAPQEDDGSPRNEFHIFRTIEYTFEALRDKGKVYIHCQWALGRAPAMAYAILRRFGFSKEEAASLINTKRPQAATWGWEKYIPSIEEVLK